MLLNVLARARAAARRLKPCQARVAKYKTTERGEVDAHRAKVQVFDMHGAHGAKQQRGRQHHEDEVGQVFHRAGANPPWRPATKPMAMKSTTGTREAMTGEFKTARQKEKNKDGNNRAAQQRY